MSECERRKSSHRYSVTLGLSHKAMQIRLYGESLTIDHVDFMGNSSSPLDELAA